MNQGRLIVIEGACDGVGKTTQFRLLKENLSKMGNKLSLITFQHMGPSKVH